MPKDAGGKREDSKVKKQRFMVYLIAAVMLFSAFYMMSDRQGSNLGSKTEDDRKSIEQRIENYKVTQIGNQSIRIKITRKTSDVIALPENKIDLNIVRDVLNSTLDGVDDIKCESSEAYILFRFHTTSEDDVNPVANNISRRLNYILGEHAVFRGYFGELPIKVSGLENIYVIGNVNLSVGDYVRAMLLQKTSSDGSMSGVMGFAKSRIPVGPVIDATVNEISHVRISGKTKSVLNVSELQDKILDSSDWIYVPPKITVNGILNISNATTIEEENKTSLPYDTENTEYLKSRNISFDVEDGSISFNIPENATAVMEDIIGNLSSYNVSVELEEKEGFISIPEEVLISDRIVQIRDYNNTRATLNMKTKAGDRIKIQLTTLQFGEQIIPFMAKEVNNTA